MPHDLLPDKPSFPFRFGLLLIRWTLLILIVLLAALILIRWNPLFLRWLTYLLPADD